jgi:trehalose 6-phosphate synthase/phosphatase
MGRILIVSRLPITVRRDEGGVKVERSAGGLATGIKSTHGANGGLWIGWPGFSASCRSTCPTGPSTRP